MVDKQLSLTEPLLDGLNDPRQELSRCIGAGVLPDAGEKTTQSGQRLGWSAAGGVSPWVYWFMWFYVALYSVS